MAFSWGEIRLVIWRGPAALAAAVACSAAGSWPVAALAQSEFEVAVSDTTVTQYERAKDQVDPLHKIRKKALEDMAMSGTLALALIPGVGAGYVVAARSGKIVVKFEDIGLESLDARSDKLQTIRAEFLDPRVQRLKQIHDSKQSLANNAEAQQILREIRANAEDPRGPFCFFLRAFFSTETIYITVRDTISEMLGDFLGGKLKSWLGLGRHSKVLWQNKTGSKLLRGLIVRRWNTLATRSQLAQKWLDDLTKEATELAVSIVYNQALQEQYNAIYERALGAHPSTVRSFSIAPAEMRIVFAMRPAEIMPLAAAVAPIRAFVPPPVIRIQSDPVANTFSIENQFVNAQNYAVSKTPTTESQSRGDDRYRPPEPRESHPTPRMPTISGSPDGGRGQTWFNR